ncbi:hypothetical protein SAMN05428997_10689 [Bosea sp. CRIB-10]|nr:hypothetical protein SAMN05428997_10689 [Bosea sp. CRIB-10]
MTAMVAEGNRPATVFYVLKTLSFAIARFTHPGHGGRPAETC